MVSPFAANICARAGPIPFTYCNGVSRSKSLAYRCPPPHLHEPRSPSFVCLSTYLFPGEAAIASTVIHSSGIPCYLENDRIITSVWAWNYAVGGIRLMVPESSFESARLLLTHDTLAEDPSPKPLRKRARACLVLCILLSPAINSLRLVYVFDPPLPEAETLHASSTHHKPSSPSAAESDF